jgi:integrase
VGTGINHLVRRKAAYLWRRRLPRAMATGRYDSIARALGTNDPELARRRARACSAAFDRAMLVLMATNRPPTRADLKAVLDDVFRRVLDDGEQARADRAPGEPPPWIPCPQEDPLYEGLDIDQWDTVPTAVDIHRQEWEDAVLTNRVSDVETLVDDAIATRGLAPVRSGPAWRRFLRLALLAAADANAIDIAREEGNYAAGFPDTCRIPAAQMPAFGPDEAAAVSQADRVNLEAGPSQAVAALRVGTSFHVLYTQWMQTKSWAPKTRGQAEAVLTRFTSLMGEVAMPNLTRAVAETFRTRLRQVPTLNGRSIFAGMTVREAAEAANRIESGLKGGKASVNFGGTAISRERAAMLTLRLSLKTLNRDLTFLNDWGNWMRDVPERRSMLADGDNPFAKLLAKKKEVARESAGRGGTRSPFFKHEIALLLANLPEVGAAEDDDERPGARRWTVLIGLYSGMRLSEIAQLRIGDFQRQDGVDFVDLTEDKARRLKSQAGARPIPLHPILIEMGLLDLVASRRAEGAFHLLPRAPADNGHPRLVNSLSKWFGRFRRGIGITAPSRVFHSTRHSFAQALRSSHQGADALADQILGHEPKGTGAIVYTQPLPMRLKAKIIASVDYRDSTVSAQTTAQSSLEFAADTSGSEKAI